MAAIATPTLVQPASGTVLSPVIMYNATVVRASALYKDTTDNSYKLADANVLGLTNVVGIAVLPGVANEYGILITHGSAELTGSTLVKGTTYYLGATPGTIVRESDLTAGCEVVIIGVAESTTRLYVNIIKTGIIL
jgi:NADP-dependent 3-hydroxy acid dehydrogenase YdfG